MIPDRLLSRLALVRRRLESVTNLPPRLSTASWLLSLSAPALDRVASWLCMRPALTVRVPSLSSAPLP